MLRLNYLLPSLALLGAPAFAQNFNLDIQHSTASSGTPQNGYAAATTQSGPWNALTFNPGGLPPTPLTDTSSTLTGVVASSSQGSVPSVATLCSPPWGGDEVALYDAISGNTGLTLNISGLAQGDYAVYTYAYADFVSPTRVSLNGGVLALISAVCPTPALHGNPDTFTSQTLSVGATGILNISVSSALVKQPWALSGVQIIQLGSGSVGTNYCVGEVNSTLMGSTISAVATQSSPGVVSVSANDLALTADNIPSSQPGLFFYGPNQIQVPFGNGFRCVGGTQGRLDIIQSFGTGQLNYTVNFTTPPSAGVQINPGSTWNFQCWYRDPAGGGLFFNLSDGTELTFGP